MFYHNEGKSIRPTKKTCAPAVVAAALLFLSAARANIQFSDPLFVDSAEIDYLIISADNPGILEQACRLAEIKWEKGLKTRVVTISQITRSSQGTDTQHKIRNFLKNAKSDWGFTWLLLFGDLELIPARKVSTNGLYFPYDTSSITSDVYYACLDGEWDEDGDGVYGNEKSLLNYNSTHTNEENDTFVWKSEYAGHDGLDLWYDVYIGRLPASNAEEARIMVDKIIAYRATPRPSDYADDMVFMSGKINSAYNSYTQGMDCDDATYYWHYTVKPYFDQAMDFDSRAVDEIYEDRVLEDGSAVEDSNEITYEMITNTFSRGYNMAFFTFHGNPRGIRIRPPGDEETPKPDYLWTRAIEIRNDYYTNILSISCSVMKMIPDSQMCFAKSFLANPRGGAVSYTGASGIDYFNLRSRHYELAVDYLTRKGVTRISKAFELANIEKFCRHNLFIHQYWGDPELELWTKSATANDTIAINVTRDEASYNIQIQPALDSVLVCVYKKDQIFLRGYTTKGHVKFDAVGAPVDNFKVSATTHNFVPGSVVVNSRAIDPRPVAAHGMGDGPLARVLSVDGTTKVAFATTNRPVQARLFDLSGKMVQEYRSQNGTSVWLLGQLTSGIYIVKAQSGELTTTSRFIIRR